MFEDLHGECYPNNGDESASDEPTIEEPTVDCDANPTHEDCIESSGYACEVTNTCDINTIYQMLPEFNLLADANYSPAVAENIKARSHQLPFKRIIEMMFSFASFELVDENL